MKAPPTESLIESEREMGGSRQRSRKEAKLACEQERLQALEENEKGLCEQRNFTSNAADRINLDRQIEALREDIENAVARCEETERELAALKEEGHDQQESQATTGKASNPTGQTD